MDLRYGHLRAVLMLMLFLKGKSAARIIKKGKKNNLIELAMIIISVDVCSKHIINIFIREGGVPSIQKY